VIAWTRIDSRLIHGQVVEAWLPHLAVRRVVVADDAAAADPMTRMAYGLAVPPDIEVVLSTVGGTDFAALAGDGVRTLLLFRDVKSAVAARARGLPAVPLNLGNVHSGPGREAISRSVFLDQSDTDALHALAAGGMEVSVQAVPSEKSQPLR